MCDSIIIYFILCEYSRMLPLRFTEVSKIKRVPHIYGLEYYTNRFPLMKCGGWKPGFTDYRWLVGLLIGTKFTSLSLVSQPPSCLGPMRLATFNTFFPSEREGRHIFDCSFVRKLPIIKLGGRRLGFPDFCGLRSILRSESDVLISWITSCLHMYMFYYAFVDSRTPEGRYERITSPCHAGFI